MRCHNLCNLKESKHFAVLQNRTTWYCTLWQANHLCQQYNIQHQHSAFSNIVISPGGALCPHHHACCRCVDICPNFLLHCNHHHCYIIIMHDQYHRHHLSHHRHYYCITIINATIIIIAIRGRRGSVERKINVETFLFRYEPTKGAGGLYIADPQAASISDQDICKHSRRQHPIGHLSQAIHAEV